MSASLQDSLPGWAIALEAVQQQIELLRITMRKLREVQQAGGANALEIQAQISACELKLAAKFKQRDVLVNTRPAVTPPGPAAIAQLRAAVDALARTNATAATIKGIVNQAFALADVVMHGPATAGGGGSATSDFAPLESFAATSSFASATTPLRPGRYQGAASQLSIDLRIGGDDGVVSADLFRLSADGQRTWVASLRNVPGSGSTGLMKLHLEDRYGAASAGTLTLTTTNSNALHGSLTVDGRLDGLPFGREIAFAADFIGEGQRALGLEIEIETGVGGPPEVTYREAKMSIEVALGRAGIDTYQVGRPDALPPAPAGGWSEKQIENLMRSAAQIDLSARNFSLQVLWLSHSNRPGLLGVMFDTNDDRPRQSVAVFADAIRANTQGDAATRDRKLIQTAVHEIGHALNLVHRFEREVGRADSHSCMNYDWRYLGGKRARDYWNKFEYGFDHDELAFLRHAPYPAIVQGGVGFHSVRYWHEGTGGYSPYVPEVGLPDLALQLLPPANGTLFDFAQPVLLGLRLTNNARTPLTVPASLLDAKAGFVELLIRKVSRGRASVGEPESFRPVMARCFDLAQEVVKVIPPNGGVHEDNVNLTFGAAGFSFAEPGRYEVQALLVVHDPAREVDRIAPSNVLMLEIQYPTSREEHADADLILTREAGQWFALGAPERLGDVGDKLLGLAEKRVKSDGRNAVSGAILRTAMFGAARPGYSQIKEAGVEAKGVAQAATYAAELQKLGLGFLDPVSSNQTQRYIRETFDGSGRKPKSRSRK